MKKGKALWLLLLLTWLIIPQVSFGQSDNDELLDKCAANLGTYNYIKSFKVNTGLWKKVNSEYSYVFSKGSTYILIACNESTDKGKMIISLYDRNKNLIASNYDENTKNYYSDLLFPCSATGVYYIRITFEGMRRGHGICILGFNKEL
jgi:hypothetical protein